MDERARLWLEQARNDLAWAVDSQEDGHHFGACFVAQQAAEKALKALAFQRGIAQVHSHSLSIIAKALGENGEIEEAARVLDPFYIPTRYPDALPGTTPAESYGRAQSDQAIQTARLVLNRVSQEIDP